MSTIYKASNIQLISEAPFSQLKRNYSSGVNTITVTKNSKFLADKYILIGEFGVETSELIQISNVNADGITLTLASNLKFGHPESTRVYLLNYHQARFYYGFDDSFPSANPFPDDNPVNIDPSSLYTTYTSDGSLNETYGFYTFYNGTNESVNSNAIPVEGFSGNSVRKLIQEFYSMLDDAQAKTVSLEDAFTYLKEAFDRAKKHLNLVNNTFNVPLVYQFPIYPGFSEEPLPNDFSKIDSVTIKDPQGNVVSNPKQGAYGATYADGVIRWYLRGNKIGFLPQLTGNAYVVELIYKSKAESITSFDQIVSLPDGLETSLKYYMIWASSPKTHRTDGAYWKSVFDDDIGISKLTSHKQTDEADSWGFDERFLS